LENSLNCSVALSVDPSVSDMVDFHFTIVNATNTVVGKTRDEDPTILASVEQEDIMQPLLEIKLTKEEKEDQEEEVVEAVTQKSSIRVN
jgi:hypothetical protein